MTVTQEDIERGLRELGLNDGSHVLAHSSYKAFGGVDGGPPRWFERWPARSQR